MDDIIERIEASIIDKVLVRGEKKALKQLIAEKQINKR
jgi:hypothetical protein